MDDRTPTILLGANCTSDEILNAIGLQAKVAFQAELDFFEWQAENEPAHFEAFMDQYLTWHVCSEPLAESYARIKREYPQLMQKVEAIVLPIKCEIFGTE